MSLDKSSQINNNNKSSCQAQAKSQESLNTCSHPGVNSLAAVALAISKHDEVNQQQQHQPSSISTSSQMVADLSTTLARSSYSGIDKLLLASMVEETSPNNIISTHSTTMPTYSNNNNNTTAASIHHQNNPMSISMTPHMFAAPPPQQQLFLAPSATNQVPYIPVGRGIGGSGLNSAYSSQSMLNTSSSRDSIMNIPTPRNKSELELYKLLEKANLLNYFGTFLSCGGDDVQQLSDADEEEFLEIMTLIGMTQKPLHVRRLQRALYEWRDGRGEIFDSPYKRPNPNMISAGGANSFHFIGRHHNGQQQSPASHQLRSSHQHQQQQHQQQQHYSSAHNNLFNGNYHDNERNQSRSSTTIMVESPAPTPNSISSSQALTTSDLNTSASSMAQPQYSSPHEVLIGAPKRPRLMDSIKPRDLTKLITVDDLEEDKLATE